MLAENKDKINNSEVVKEQEESYWKFIYFQKKNSCFLCIPVCFFFINYSISSSMDGAFRTWLIITLHNLLSFLDISNFCLFYRQLQTPFCHPFIRANKVCILLASLSLLSSVCSVSVQFSKLSVLFLILSIRVIFISLFLKTYSLLFIISSHEDHGLY